MSSAACWSTSETMACRLEAGEQPTYFGFWESNVNAYTDDELELCDPIYGALPYRLARCRIERG
jgi:hypothetical protein